MSSTQPTSDQEIRSGVIAIAGAFSIWGLLPLYLKPLNSIPALQIAGWRYLMGCVVVVGWLGWRGELPHIRRAFGTPALLGRLTATASLLAVNWTLYAWGVAHGQVLLTSLGYFINPLVNVVLGVLVLSERLNLAQWGAVTIATIGVVALTVQSGHAPWISLALALTFSLYGLLRKTAPVAPLPGLAVETLLFSPLALGYLLSVQQQQGNVLDHSALMLALLACSGVVSIIPLTLFNYGAQRINYATVGMLQYIGPTLQFLIGILIYREPLSQARLVCFALIWLALGIYVGDAWRRSRALRAQQL
jgi:chloramphenicol-sensitive protein RarD